MAELRVVTTNNGFIAESIATGGQGTVTTVAGYLLGENLIKQEVYEEAIYGQAPPRNVAPRLLVAVLGTIKLSASPERCFADFLRALRNSDLGDVVDRLEAAYCEFSHSLSLSLLTFCFHFAAKEQDPRK